MPSGNPNVISSRGMGDPPRNAHEQRGRGFHSATSPAEPEPFLLLEPLNHPTYPT